MDKKTICYLCKGCDIGDALNFEGLTEAINEAGGVDEIKEHDALCSPEGVEMIQADVDAGATHLLLGACSPRVKSGEFSFGDAVIERCPLREFAVWATEPTYEGEEEEGICRQEVGEDYLRLSIAKLDKCTKPTPYQIEGEVYKTIMVVGGGPAGMTAAIEAAKAGSQVVLVEKEAQLGGFMTKMAKRAPETPPYAELEEVGLEDMVAAIEGDANIQVFTGTTVAKTAGMPGNFDVELSNGEALKIGAIVQATGWLPYEKENLKDDLSSDLPGVLSNVEMEEKAKAGDLGGLGGVAFIQCAGSRDENHLPYCSAFCCTVSCKQAIMVKEANPEAAVYIIYKDVRTPGQSEEIYREAQRKGVIFIRRDEEYPKISESGGKLSLVTKDVLLDDDIEIDELDHVVLATGMKTVNPKMVDSPLIPFDMPDEEGKRLTKEALAQNEQWSVLNLAYRQGPNLPTLKYAMPDSHFICFPYESRRTGIYPAGNVRKPLRLTQAFDDGAGAALKAIQVIRAAEVGCAVYPRSGDESFPEFAMQRCTQCKRCTEECPFGAINEDEKANPLPNITRCRRCGTCMGACPERIISFKNYSVDMIGSMIKSISIPEEDEERPRVICLICENDALPALEMAARRGLKWNPYVRFVPVRCLGSVNLVWIADSLSKGVDGVILFGCKRGDDYQCHFVRGSELANVRMSKISETLQRLALEPERVRVDEVAINELDKIPTFINEFMETIEEVGMNPFKGF
jgi:quinone-modifying oxidoreductase, subunit QmoB